MFRKLPKTEVLLKVRLYCMSLRLTKIKKNCILSGLIKLKDLLRISSYSDMKKVKMSILQYDPNYQYDPHFQYKKLLKDIKKTEHNIVLSVSNDKVMQILKQVSIMRNHILTYLLIYFISKYCFTGVSNAKVNRIWQLSNCKSGKNYNFEVKKITFSPFSLEKNMI
jgi:hypothetical protein